MTAINEIIQDEVIAISFLDQAEYERMESQWVDRFRPDQTILIKTSVEEKPMAAMQRVHSAIKDQGYDVMSGLRVILAGFLDLRGDSAVEQTRFLKEIAYQLSAVGCIVSLKMQFAYIGEIPSPERKKIQSNVKMVADEGNGRLCLVGKYGFDENGGNNWRATVMLLDALRRSTDYVSMLPKLPNGSEKGVGFLKYAEFSQERLNNLEKRKLQIERELGDKGTDELSFSVVACLEEISRSAGKDFPADGKKHPYHPDMIVENKGVGPFNKRNKAKKGDNKEYNAAAAATVEAVEATAKQMRRKMEARYIPTDEQAMEWMRRFLEDGKVGIKCILGMQNMRQQLSLTPDENKMPQVLTLPYSEDGCADRIGYYLTEYRKYCCYLCKEATLKKLEAALERLKPEYEAKVPALESELKSVSTKLGRMLTRDKFIAMVASKEGGRMETNFNPTNPDIHGDIGRVVLWRDPADQKDIEENCQDTGYEIDAAHGNLKRLDEFQIKAIHFFLAPCTDLALSELIK